MKKISQLILLLLILICTSNYVKVHNPDLNAAEKQRSVGDSNSLSYEISIENNIVELNNEICVTFKLSENNNNCDVSVISTSFVPQDRTIINEDGIKVYVINNHPAGEYSFDVSAQDSNELSFNKTMYIYSDGVRDCISSACIEEARDIYFTNFIATDEELFLLGKMDDESVNSHTEIYYDTIMEYESFVYKNTNVSYTTTRKIDIADGKIKINGEVKWEDSAGGLQPLIDNYVYLYEEAEKNEKYGYVKTDNNGRFSFLVDYDEWVESGESNLFLSLKAETDAATLYMVIIPYSCSLSKIENISDNLEVYYDIVITPGESKRANAFEIAQMMYYSRKYVEAMSNELLPQITVFYPNSSEGSYYKPSLKYICLDKRAYDCWDAGMHEYGHYIADHFDFAPLTQGRHTIEEDLTVLNGKAKGLKLAYGEAIATYLGISAQLYFDLVTTNIPYVGDYKYNSYYGFQLDLPTITFGEGDENSTVGLLLALVGDVSALGLDEALLEYKILWDIIDSKKRDYMSELITDIASENSSMIGDLGILLEHFEFSPKNLSSSKYLDTKAENNTFIWEENQVRPGSLCALNQYSLVFHSNYSTDTYEINNLTSTSYTLTLDDLNHILELDSDQISWQVIGYNTNTFTTGPYFSRLVEINKPIEDDLYLGNSYSNSLLEGEVAWYKFVVPKAGTYEFTSSGPSDVYGELFSSIVANGSTYNRLENGFDDDAGDDRNFKIVYNLSYKQVIYLRVRGYEYRNAPNFSVLVECTHHDHAYEYRALNSSYHILKCHCGETSGSEQRHILDGGNHNPIEFEKKKPCIYCGYMVDVIAGEFYPIIINNQIIYIPTSNDGDISTFNKKEEIIC